MRIQCTPEQCNPSSHRAKGKTEFCQRKWLLAARARNRSFVAEINSRTFCAHCGAQPIEWHNPEHVELNRRNFRIGSMVTQGRSVEAITAEIARCTPLCRRCHLIEDGRLPAIARVAGPRPCAECGQPSLLLSRGRCRRCYRRQPDVTAATVARVKAWRERRKEEAAP